MGFGCYLKNELLYDLFYNEKTKLVFGMASQEGGGSMRGIVFLQPR